MIRLEPISYYNVFGNPSQYNSGNLHEYDPYLASEDGKEISIDRDWFNSLPLFGQMLLMQRLGKENVVFDTNQTIETPHRRVNTAGELIVYKTYIDMHDFQCWSSAVWSLPDFQGVLLIQITADDKKCLAEITQQRLEQGKLLQSINASGLFALKKKLISLMIHCPKSGYFMRLSGTSGKNEKSVEPIYTADQAVDALTDNAIFLHQEYQRLEKTTCIVLRPWLDQIEKKNEFRVFVHNGAVTGVSQQHWKELFCYSAEELQAVQKAIANASFLKPGLAPYHSFVADVWVSFDDEKCHLIEYNPFGAHCGAGSALFEWQRDHEILYGKQEAQFRFTSLLLGSFETN